MDQDIALLSFLCAEADLAGDSEHPGHSSFQAGAPLIAAESADHGTLPQQSKSVGRNGREGFVLSSEELQIITLIISGFTNHEMARRLCSTEAAIDRRTQRIIEKFGVANTLELVLYALSHRVVNWFPWDSN